MGNMLLALCLGLAALAPVAPAAPPAAHLILSATYDCEGDACASITFVWEDESQSFRASNSSDRRVRVEVETFGGKSAVTVEPHKSEYLPVKTFNGPYRATFE